MRRWSPALAAQLSGWLCALVLLGAPGPGLAGVLPQAVLAALAASLASLLLREPRWRAPMQAGFALAAGLGSQAAVPAWLWALALLACLLVFGGGLTGRRAPLYLTQPRALQALLECLPEDLDGACLDAGAGIGSFILRVAPLRPRLHFSGIERSPLVCLLGDLRCRLNRRGRVRFGDLWRTPLGDYRVVYAFLSPEAMEGLWNKACKEMEAGSLLLVNAFPVPGVDPSLARRYGDGRSDCVYGYRLPGRPAGGAAAEKLSSSPR